MKVRTGLVIRETVHEVKLGITMLGLQSVCIMFVMWKCLIMETCQKVRICMTVNTGFYLFAYLIVIAKHLF